MRDLELNPHDVLRTLEEHVRGLPASSGNEVQVASPTKLVFKLAFHQAIRSGRQTIESSDLFAAIFEESQGAPVAIVRRGAGRPKGSKDPHARAKEQDREHARLRISAELDPIIDAAIARAKGLRHLQIRNKKTGKFERVTDPERITTILSGKAGAEYEIWEIWTRDPDIAAIRELLDRCIEKPREQAHVAGDVEKFIARINRGSGWRRRRRRSCPREKTRLSDRRGPGAAQRRWWERGPRGRREGGAVTDAQLATLETFYRTLSTERLDDYRIALWLDRETARRSATPAADITEAFCSERLAVIAHVLASRGLKYRIDDNRRITCLTCGLVGRARPVSTPPESGVCTVP